LASGHHLAVHSFFIVPLPSFWLTKFKHPFSLLVFFHVLFFWVLVILDFERYYDMIDLELRSRRVWGTSFLEDFPGTKFSNQIATFDFYFGTGEMLGQAI